MRRDADEPRQTRFSQSDITWAVKGARTAGVKIAGVEIDTEGGINVKPGRPSKNGRLGQPFSTGKPRGAR
jgi:hypothetical protein